ncbi:MAG: DUF2478 domain-containing protein [Pseudorhodobacter sp.]|nr:DUF2478 domain-containing protein [Pseudorhodobacter sp.]
MSAILYAKGGMRKGAAVLGYVTADEHGLTDLVLAAVAARLQALDWPLAGVVQVNANPGPDCRCAMDLHVLQGAQVVRISQNLGPLSRGCRLNSGALEQAVGLVETALDARPRLLIINKFGKAEIEGRGFRPLIGRAMVEGLPVLTAVHQDSLAGFQAFAEGLGQALPPDPEAVLEWCLARAT